MIINRIARIALDGYVVFRFYRLAVKPNRYRYVAAVIIYLGGLANHFDNELISAAIIAGPHAVGPGEGHVDILSLNFREAVLYILPVIVAVVLRVNRDDVGVRAVRTLRHALLHGVEAVLEGIDCVIMFNFSIYAIYDHIGTENVNDIRHFGHFRLGAGIGLLARFIDNNLNYIVLNLA